MSRTRRLAVAAAIVVVAAALLVMGDLLDGLSGLADVACALALAGLVAIRGWLGLGETPALVRDKGRRHWKRRRAVSAAAFPGFGGIASQVSMAGVSQRHYEYGLRRRLARLAAGKGIAPQDLAGPPSGDEDAPGPDLAAIERLIRRLEET